MLHGTLAKANGPSRNMRSFFSPKFSFKLFIVVFLIAVLLAALQHETPARASSLNIPSSSVPSSSVPPSNVLWGSDSALHADGSPSRMNRGDGEAACALPLRVGFLAAGRSFVRVTKGGVRLTGYARFTGCAPAHNVTALSTISGFICTYLSSCHQHASRSPQRVLELEAAPNAPPSYIL